jgi:hypothetical protein
LRPVDRLAGGRTHERREPRGDRLALVELGLHDVAELDDLLFDLALHVCLNVLVEPLVVLLAALPDLGHGDTFGVWIRDVQDETGLLLAQRAIARDWTTLYRHVFGAAPTH